MKKLAYIILVACLFAPFVKCNMAETKNEVSEYYMFSSFHEPADEGLRLLYSADGINWDSIPGTWLKPEIGQNIMRDPSISYGPDSLYHLVWTIAWKGDTGFGHASSPDLVNWSEQRRIPAMDSIASTQNVWAPELFYDDVKGQYMIVYSSCVVDAGFEVGIEDEKNNHRLYYVTTKDFEEYSEPKLLYDPGFSCIDATLLKCGPEDYVMVLKDNTRPERNLKIAFATDPEGPWGPSSEPFTENFSEGPSVAQVGDDYYVYYDSYQRKVYGAMKTKDFVNFEDAFEEVKIPEGHKHGTIFKAPAAVVEAMLSDK